MRKKCGAEMGGRDFCNDAQYNTQTSQKSKPFVLSEKKLKICPKEILFFVISSLFWIQPSCAQSPEVERLASINAALPVRTALRLRSGVVGPHDQLARELAQGPICSSHAHSATARFERS